YAPPIILTYIASVSSIVGCCILLKFLYFCMDYPSLQIQVSSVIKPIALIAIVLCSFFALKASDLKHIIIYSSAINVGYVVLLVFIPSAQIIILKFLLIDWVNKVSLFLIVAQKEDKSFLPGYFWVLFVALTIICSAGLPLSAMFILKLNLLELLIRDGMFIEFIVIVISSAMSILYHYGMTQKIFMKDKIISLSAYRSKPENIGMILLIVLQIILFLSHNWFNKVWYF
ncbi:MAG: proton-conducting transporter membrane subunit, partial [Janthinobacterium lividum]